MNTQVEAITEVGGAVFTGGDKRTLSRRVARRLSRLSLAGYEVGTGELRRSFRPKINGQVKSVEVSTNGFACRGVPSIR